jgi:hypothetical protein
MAGPTTEKLDERLRAVEATVNQFSGATRLAKWGVGLSIGAIVTAVGALVWMLISTSVSVARHEERLKNVSDQLAGLKAILEKEQARQAADIERLNRLADKRIFGNLPTAEGSLLRAGGGKIAILEDGKEREFTLTKDATVFQKGQAARLVDLQPGARVRVTYEPGDPERAVRLDSPPPPKEP